MKPLQKSISHLLILWTFCFLGRLAHADPCMDFHLDLLQISPRTDAPLHPRFEILAVKAPEAKTWVRIKVSRTSPASVELIDVPVSEASAKVRELKSQAEVSSVHIIQGHPSLRHDPSADIGMQQLLLKKGRIPTQNLALHPRRLRGRLAHEKIREDAPAAEREAWLQDYPLNLLIPTPGHRVLRRPEAIAEISAQIKKTGQSRRNLEDGPIVINLVTGREWATNAQGSWSLVERLQAIDLQDGHHRVLAYLESNYRGKSFKTVGDLAAGEVLITVNGVDAAGVRHLNKVKFSAAPLSFLNHPLIVASSHGPHIGLEGTQSHYDVGGTRNTVGHLPLFLREADGMQKFMVFSVTQESGYSVYAVLEAARKLKRQGKYHQVIVVAEGHASWMNLLIRGIENQPGINLLLSDLSLLRSYCQLDGASDFKSSVRDFFSQILLAPPDKINFLEI